MQAFIDDSKPTAGAQGALGDCRRGGTRWLGLGMIGSLAIAWTTAIAEEPRADATAATATPMALANAKGDTHFSFERQGVIIKRPAGMPGPGPYYVCLVDMKPVKGFPYEIALYFSTDHQGSGGIWLYVCNGSPTDAANWKSYDEAVKEGRFDYLQQKPKGNPVFKDIVQGFSTETPHLNVIDGTVYMTYHNVIKGNGQKTLLATSPDGVNFSRINGDVDSVILPKGGMGSPGRGEHTGYFRWAPNPFSRLKHKFIGYSLYMGGDNYQSAMWVSNDAIHWDLEQVFKPIEGHTMAEKDQILIPHQIDANSIRPMGNGEYIGIATGGNRASGGNKRVVEVYEIFFAADGKSYARESRKLLPRGVEGSFDEEEVADPTTMVIGNTWHLLYVGASNGAKVNTVMGAVGRLNLDTPMSRPLNEGDRQRHFKQ